MSNKGNNTDPARKLARVLEQGKAEAQFKAPLPKKKAPVAAPRKPRPFSPERGPKPAQRGRSPAKTDMSARVPSQSPISRQRKPAMKDRSRSRSRSASVTREAPLPTDHQQLAELMAFKQQQQQEHVNSWKALQLAPPSGMTQREKIDFRNQLAKEDEKRRAFEANSKRQQEELEANRKRLQEREQELQRQEAKLNRQRAEFERQKAAADLDFQTTLVRGQGKPNAYVTRTLAAQGPGPGYEVGRPLPYLTQTGPVSQTRANSPEYASIAEGKKKKNRKRSVKNKKGNKKKKKGGKVSKKN